MFLQIAFLVSASPTLAVSNPNCVSRGKCIAVGPGTKYPEQNTMCLADENNKAWHCAALAGKWGTNDHTFGPQNTLGECNSSVFYAFD